MTDRVDFAAIAQAIAQQLEADRVLGVREVPIARVRRCANDAIDQGSPPAESAFGLTGSKEARLCELDERYVKGCSKCGLHKSRTQTVFGQGNPEARLVFVGEGPGYHEDQQGKAFVGRAGELLSDIIKAMQLTREQVFICNVVKCRPPENRTPAVDEMVACSPYLFEQLRTIQPQIIVALGAPAARTLLDTTESIGRLRGRFHQFYPDEEGGLLGGKPIKLMATYHPAYLLRNPNDKRKVWEDMKMVMTELGIPIPEQYR